MSIGQSAAVRPVDELLEIYRRHGFDAGYHQALRDQLAGLVEQAERFLQQHEATGEERRALYAFVSQLEQDLTRKSPFVSGGFVDGAGI